MINDILTVIDLYAFVAAGVGGLALIATLFVPRRALATFALACIGAGLATGAMVLAARSLT